MTVKDELVYGPNLDLFSDIRESYDSHSDNCVSLHFFWFAHRGGVSCFSDLDECFDCNVMFYSEGLVYSRWNDEDYDWDEGLCACCAENRGFKVRYSRSDGVSLVS